MLFKIHESTSTWENQVEKFCAARTVALIHGSVVTKLQFLG